MKSDSRSRHSVTIKDKSCDLVIMNPPFTRPTNHEASHAEIPVPSFAGFNTSHDEQQAMGRKLKKPPPCLAAATQASRRTSWT